MSSIESAATVWVDTNVVSEIFSHGDLTQIIQRNGSGAVIEDCRMHLQQSLWMAMALCNQNATSWSYDHESDRVIEKLSPQGSAEAQWTKMILYCMGDGGVFDGWNALTRSDAEELDTTDERDDYMISCCKEESLTLLSRDKKAVRKAKAAGVRALRPEEYAQTVLSKEKAHSLFLERMTFAVKEYPNRYPADVQEFRRLDAEQLFLVYRDIIWAPAGSIEYTD